MAEPTAAAGVVMPPLVAALRAALPKDAAYLHFGATSQDIVDTATLLQLRPVIDELKRGSTGSKSAEQARRPTQSDCRSCPHALPAGFAD